MQLKGVAPEATSGLGIWLSLDKGNTTQPTSLPAQKLPANNNHEFLNRPYYNGLGDQLDATIRGSQEESDLSARQLEWNRWCVDKGQGVFRMVDAGYRLCEAANHELYLKDTTEGPLIFACDKITDKNPGCTIAEPAGAQWGVLTLKVGRKYLYQADEIRKRFRSLLDSFAEN
jgi:hypothetical protein